MSGIFIIAGEASGDLHASRLIEALKKLQQGISITGVGGDKTKKEGCKLIFHYQKIAFMGFSEVIKQLPVIINAFSRVKKEILKTNPDVIVFVDYPGFNLRMARWAKKKGYNTVYFIPPQVWAWREKRAYKLKKYLDQIICLFPFEKEFYRKFDMEVLYFGHPMVDEYNRFQASNEFLSTYNLNKNGYVALFPGSRKQEIESILPVMVETTRRFPQEQFVLAAGNDFNRDYFENFLADTGNITLIENNQKEIMAHAKTGIITSGTATLEAALSGMPMVVVYKTTSLNYRIFKFFAKVNFISLVNLVAGKQLVRELIQDEFTFENTSMELKKLLTDIDYTREMKKGFEEVRRLLSPVDSNAYTESSRIVLSLIND